MSTETIRDERGRIIGYIVEEGETLRLRGPQHQTLGYYSLVRDHTMDVRHKIIGRGNQLLRLLR